MKRTMTVYRG